MRRIACAALAGLAAACAPTAAPGADEQWQTVAVTAEPVRADVETVGQLAYRGGLHLISRNRMFVGLSGMEVLENGRVVAVGDEADWIEGQLVLDDEGRLTGFTNVRGAFLRDERGRPFTSKAQGDSEGLAQLPDGRFAVSFERTNLIRIYDLNRDGPFGAAAMGPVLDEVRDLPGNSGFEALAALDNALLVGAEGGEHDTTPLWLAPLDARAPTSPLFSYPLSGGYSLTALDRLPDGGFVALERFYAPVVGPRARITRFVLAEGEDGPVEPEVLAELAPPFPIDNFEAISAVRMPDGTTRLYILSDNNGSHRQRTLLLAFDIVEAPN